MKPNNTPNFWRILDLGGQAPVRPSPEAAWAAWEELRRSEQGARFNFGAQTIIRDAVLICGNDSERLKNVLRYEAPDSTWQYADIDQTKAHA